MLSTIVLLWGGCGDGAKVAVRTAHSRRAFVAVCVLVLDVPAVAVCLAHLQWVSPNVVLPLESWGHDDHLGVDCGCRSSDRTGAYVQ